MIFRDESRCPHCMALRPLSWLPFTSREVQCEACGKSIPIPATGVAFSWAFASTLIMAPILILMIVLFRTDPWENLILRITRACVLTGFTSILVYLIGFLGGLVASLGMKHGS